MALKPRYLVISGNLEHADNLGFLSRSELFIACIYLSEKIFE
ncbi:MAG: Hydrolase or acyltransferase [Candidatus Tokpelaia sp. JSC189]|nr:MAG: Hydrolase or acyltransferase [Candidatus Tokpelaia sp. JSC189]